MILETTFTIEMKRHGEAFSGRERAKEILKEYKEVLKGCGVVIFDFTGVRGCPASFVSGIITTCLREYKIKLDNIRIFVNPPESDYRIETYFYKEMKRIKFSLGMKDWIEKGAEL